MKDIEELYRKMVLIRCFEEKVLELFSENKVSGTTHTYIGQEAIAVAAMKYIQNEDIVFSNHRCHGHYLAYGGPAELLLAEIMTKQTGICGGRGGSQHLHYKNFYTNGVQGGIVPNGTGMAWAHKINDSETIAVIFLGDGTLGQGIVYETLNMAALYEIPVLYIVEENGYAMTTRTEHAVSGNIKKRFEAFGIDTFEVSGNNIEILDKAFSQAFYKTRSQHKPVCQIVHTYRLGAHSKGDDTRNKDEIEFHQAHDPILIAEQNFPELQKDSIWTETKKYINDISYKVIETEDSTFCVKEKRVRKNITFPVCSQKNSICVNTINQALDYILKTEQQVMLLGEDICDSYGGAFKVTKGLSTKYQKRVINTPISEAAITGIAIGLAMGGRKPIVEIMFGDFSTLVLDQILNHATKYEQIYGKAIKVPLVIRMPMGCGRGYGPTHSQSLEKLFMGIPGLTIMSASLIHNLSALYPYAIKQADSPLVIIENKRMYSQRMLAVKDGKINDFLVTQAWNEIFPTIKLSLAPEERADITLITYGNFLIDLMEISKEAMLNEELQIDLIVVSQLLPLPIKDLLVLIPTAEVIGTVEEGTLTAGWGAEIIATSVELNMAKKYFRVGADDTIIPNGIKLERSVSVNKEKIIQKIKEVLS